MHEDLDGDALSAVFSKDVIYIGDRDRRMPAIVFTFEQWRTWSAAIDARIAEAETPTEKPAAIDPGEGYRLLDEGEEIFDTDEMWHGEKKGWLVIPDVFTIGHRQRKGGDVFRRKIAAIKAYRRLLLRVGEIMQEGDEVCDSENQWYAVPLDSIGRAVCDEDGLVRRKVAAPSRQSFDPVMATCREVLDEMLAEKAHAWVNEYYKNRGHLVMSQDAHHSLDPRAAPWASPTHFELVGDGKWIVPEGAQYHAPLGYWRAAELIGKPSESGQSYRIPAGTLIYEEWPGVIDGKRWVPPAGALVEHAAGWVVPAPSWSEPTRKYRVPRGSLRIPYESHWPEFGELIRLMDRLGFPKSRCERSRMRLFIESSEYTGAKAEQAEPAPDESRCTDPTCPHCKEKL